MRRCKRFVPHRILTVCLQGGMITQVEQEEMPRLLSEAKSDAEKSGVKLLYSSRNMSYCEFLEDYGTA